MKPVRVLIVAALAAALSITVVVAAPSANAAVSASITQCANGATVTTCDGGWITGALNLGNSEFHEDDVVPQRMVVTGLAPNSSHTATIVYDAKKNGVHGYDSIARYNYTVTDADPCGGPGTIPPLCGGPASTLEVPPDLTAVPPAVGSNITGPHELPDADRSLTMYGATITFISNVSHSSPNSPADTASVVVTFTVGSTGSAILLWGTHLAVGTTVVGAPRNWGPGFGASNVAGGSLATQISKMDTNTNVGGNNTIQSNAIGVFPPAAFTISKTSPTTTVAAGGNVTYTTTVTNTGGTAGSTTFTDNYNDNASVVGSLPSGCVDSTAGTDEQFTCTTGTINPGDSQVFTYTLKMPTSFTGASDCTGGYNVTNTATLNGSTGASKTVCVTAAATYSITKTASSPTSTTGGSITYTVTVKNTGTASGSTSFTDTASNGVTPTFVSPTVPSGGTCTSANVCTTSTLNPGDTQKFTFTATMPSSFTGPTTCTGGYTVTNTATISGVTPASAEVCVSANAGFSITKTASSPTSTTGGSITYTVTVKNTGTASGSTSFTDTASNGVTPTFVSPTVPSGGTCTSANVCTTSTLNPGDTQKFTFTATMPSSFTGSPSPDCATSNGGYKVTNTATLDGAGSDSAPVCVAAAATFSISKSPETQTAAAGGDAGYAVTITNTGTAPGSTSFTDDYNDAVTPGTLPAGCVDSSVPGNDQFTCTTGSLNPGAHQDFTYSMTMPASFSGQPQLGCELVAIGSYPVVNTATIGTSGPSDSATVCVSTAPDFSITKSPSSPTAGPGDQIAYTVTVTNNGSGPGSISFTDDYNDDATPQDPLPVGCFDSSVTGNDTFTCTTGSIDPGDHETFTYDVTMPSAFSGTPSGCDNGGFPVANSVTLSGGGDSDSAKVCVTTTPKFTVTKTATSTTADPGTPVEYTVVVTNDGSGPGTTSFTDNYDDDASPVLPLPDGCTDTSTTNDKKFTCDTGSIDPGRTQTFVYEITMPGTFTGTPAGCADGGYPVANTVTITGGGSTDSETVCVDATPDLSVSKSVSPGSPGPGDGVTYTVTVTNNGTAPGGTTVTDDYDQDHLTLGDIGDCTDDGDILTCDTGTIEAGDHVDIVYTATITDAFTGDADCDVDGTPGYSISNTATIGPDDGDSVDICVPASADFSLEKTVDPTTADAGDTVHYTIVVTNSGDAEGSTGFTDNYDDRVDADLPTGSLGGTCSRLTDGDDIFSCLSATIPAHSSETFEYDAVLPGSFGSDAVQCDGGGFSVSNVASLVTGGAEAPAEVCVTAAPLFHVDKSADDTSAKPDQEVAYTIVVTNDGTAAGSTTFTDNYADRLDGSITAPEGCTKADVDGDLVLRCETDTIEPGGSQTFTYTATMPDALGGSGGDCADGSFPIVNSVTVDVSDDDNSDSVTICVPAKPHFQITKSADDTSAVPGQTIHYIVTVSNDGHVATSTTFTDAITPALTATNIPDGCDAAGGVLTCTTGTIQPGHSQDFEYDVTLPATYTGDSGGDDCDPGQYPVRNTATITSAEHGDPASTLVCVTAAPALHLSKSVDKQVSTDSTVLTYTIDYSNTGPAEATHVVMTDQVPDGTTFVSCTGCTHSGTPDTATWNIGTVAPVDGHGSVQLVVRVTGKQACSVSNTAQIDAADVDPVSSNTVVTAVTPPSDPTGANAHGSGAGAQVLTAGLINLLIGHNGDPIGYSSSSQTGPGGPVIDADSVLSAKVPSSGSLVSVGLVNTSSASAVNGSPIAARQLSSAEVANVCLLPVSGVCTVEASAVRAVAATLANGTTVGTSSAGSSIANLKIAGLGTPVDLNSTTKITLNPLVFGPGSYVAINEHQSTTGLKDGKLYADMTTTMIHLKVTGLLRLQSAEIIVGQAKAHSEFLKTFECNPNANSVSGHAYVAGVDTGPLQTNVIQGFVGMGPKGGGSEQHLVALTLPANGGLVAAKVADSSTLGTVTGTSADSFSVAEVAGEEGAPACVVRTSPTACLVTAAAVRSEARSHADQTNGSVSTSAASTLVGVKVLGIPVDVDVPPNTTINLPGIGYVVLNEQTCDGGGLAVNGSCSGYPHSGITVRAVHVVVTVLGNVLGLQPAVQVVVAEAHADSTVY